MNRRAGLEGKWASGSLRPGTGQAFSMVEVVFSLAIATFGILAVLSLLPAGIESNRESIQETGAIDVLSEVVADRQSSPFTQGSTAYRLPALTPGMAATTNVFGITEANQFTTALNQAFYRVDYYVIPPVAGALNPYQAYFRVSWPAPSPSPAGSVETMVAFPQP